MKKNLAAQGIGVLILCSFFFILVQRADAANGINQIINFQGKVVNKTDGTNVNSGTTDYNMVFSIYGQASGGSALWTETWSGGNQVPVTNGLFAVSLGSITPFGSSVNFNSDSLYLDVTFNGEDMGTRVRLTAAPYAFNAGQLDGIIATNSASNFTISGGTNSLQTLTVNGNITIGSTIQPTAAGALTVESNGANGLTLDTGGSGAVNIGNTNATSIVFGNTSTNPTFSFNGTGGVTIQGTTVTVGNGSNATIQTTSNAGLTLLSAGSGNITLGQNSGTGNVKVAPNAGGQAAFIVLDQGSGDIFTASSGANITKFTIANNGNVTDSAYTTGGGILFGTTTGLLQQSAAGTTSQCLIGGTAPTWATCSTGSSGTNLWQLNGNVISSYNTTLDLAVGGNATSSALFQVFGATGNATTSGTLAFTGTGSQIQTVRNQNLTIGGSTTGDIQFKPGNSSSSLYLATSGNVGIGTTSPLNKLEINGKVGIGVTTATNPVLDIVSGIGNGTVNESAGLRLRSNSTDGNTMTMLLGVSNVGIGGANQGYGYIDTSYWGGSANPLVLNPNGGPVAINSATGLASYSLVAGSSIDIKAPTNAGGNTLMGELAFSPSAAYSTAPSSIKGVFDKTYWYQGTGLVFNTISGSDISGSNGLERMRISSDGNVGIGAINPLAILDVRGNVQTNAGTTPVASFSGQTSFATIVANNDGVGDLFTASSSSTPRFVITNTGNVGIGTTTPAYPIEVDNTNGIAVKPGGRAYIFSADDPAGSLLFSRSDVSNGFSVIPNSSQVVFGATNGSSDLSFEQVNANTFTFDPKAGGGVGLIQFGRRYSDSNAAVGASTEFWPSSSQTLPALAVVGAGAGTTSSPGSGANYNFQVSPNGNVYIGSVTSATIYKEIAKLGVEGAFTGKALAIFNQTGNQDIFSASSAGITKFTIGNVGSITDPNYAGANAFLYAAPTTGLFTTTTTTTANQCLLSQNGSSGTPIWGACALGTNYWQVNSNVLSPANVNYDLAIGGTATGSAFQVFADANGTIPAGTASLSGQLSFTNAANQINLLNNSTLSINNSVSGDAGLTGNTALFINANGGISLGTATQVAGYPIVIGNNVAPGATDSYALGAKNKEFNGVFGKFGAFNMGLAIGSTGNSPTNLQTYGTTYGSGTTPVATISGNTSYASVVIDQSGVGDIITASKSGATKFVVTNAGNVGIGTITPTALLDTEANLSSAGTLLKNSGSGDILDLANSSGVQSYFDNNGYEHIGNVYLNTVASKFNSSFACFGGCGSTTLQMGGKAYIGNGGYNNNPGQLATLDLRSTDYTQPTASISGSTGMATLVLDQSGGVNGGDIFAASSSGLNRFVIQQNGNVGVGTTTPIYKLEVNGSLRSHGYIYADDVFDVVNADSASNPGYTWDSNLTTGMFNPATNMIGFSTNGSERMRIDSSGNVGIGTTTLNDRLTVDGNITDTGGNYFYNSNSSNLVKALFNGPGDWLGIQSDATNTFSFSDKPANSNVLGTPVLSLLLNGSGGNVGIGTTNPGSKLEVNGTITADSRIIGSGNTASIDTSENIASNSGMDVWSTSTAPYEWQSADGTNWNDGAGYVHQESTIVYSPPYSAKLGDGTDNGTGMAMNDMLRVIPGDNYMYAAKVEGGDGTAEGIFLVRAFNSSGTSITTGTPLGSGWTYSSSYGAWYNIVTPGTSYASENFSMALTSSVYFIQPAIMYYTAGVSSKYIYVDDIEITHGSLLPAFAYKPLYDTGNQTLENSLFVRGNVGVGTTTPGAPIAIKSALNTNAGNGTGIYVTSGTSTAQIWQRFDGRIAFAPDISVSGSFVDMYNDGSNNLNYELQSAGGNDDIKGYNANLELETNSGSNKYIDFLPNQVEAMRIDQNGMVGIGNILMGNDPLVVNQANSSGDIFSASQSGSAKFTISNSGNITASNYTTNGGIFYANGSGLFTQLADIATGSCLISGGVSTVPSWGSCGSGGGTNYWQLNSGALSPAYSPNDLLIGGTSTSSAVFGLINVGSGVPTATISGNFGLQVPTVKNSNIIFGALNGESLKFQTSVGGDAGLTSRFYIANSGFIGVNTINPLANLDINGSASISSTLLFDKGGSDAQLGVLNGFGLKMQTSVGGDGTLSTREYIANNGNVGINTITPSAILDVNGAASISGQLALYGTPAIQVTANQNLALGGATTGNIILQPLNGYGNVGINTATPGTNLDVENPSGNNTGTYAFQVKQFNASSYGAYIFVNHDSSTIDALNVQGMNGAFVVDGLDVKGNGNVGIGTTTPAEKLQIAGGNILLDNTQGIFFKNAGGNEQANPVLQLDSTNTVNIQTVASAGNLVLGLINNGGNGVIKLLTKDTEHVRLDSNGLFGIGSNFAATPALGTLDVRAQSGILPVASISGQTSFAALTVDNSGVGDIITASSSGLSRFVITQAGNVGIGTTTPGASLDLASGTILGAGLSSDCSGTNSKLLWSASTKQFSCGTDKPNIMIVKSADQTVNNSTTLVNDNDITWSIGANETYIFHMALVYNSNTTANFSSSWSVPSGATCSFSYDAGGSNATNTASAGCGVTTMISGSGADRIRNVYGTIINGSTAGTVQWKWAQNTANASNTTVRGTGTFIVAYKTTGADYAETYYTKDATIQPGTVVSIDGSLGAGFKKSEGTYDNGLLGVVSTKPGQVIGDVQSNGIPMPIALAGRVPVKVNLEGGPIQPGDPLTSSSTPGVAMKATQAGQIIGKALTAFDSSMGTEGEVIMFMNVGYDDPNNILAHLSINSSGSLIVDNNFKINGNVGIGITTPQVASPTGYLSSEIVSANSQQNNAPISFQLTTSITQLQTQVASMTAQLGKIDDLSKQVAELMKSENLMQAFQNVSTQAAVLGAQSTNDNATVSGSLSVLGDTLLTHLGVTGTISTGVLSINGMDELGNASINTLSGPLKLQSDSINGIDIANGKVTIDTSGNIVTEGNITAKTVHADKFEVTDTGTTASVGQVIIPIGKTDIQVTTSALTSKSKIFVEPENIPVSTAIQKTAGDSFIIKVQQVQSAAVTLDWWIVN